MFSSVDEHTRGFSDDKVKGLNKNSGLFVALGNLLRYLKEKIFKPCRISGMRIYQDFEE